MQQKISFFALAILSTIVAQSSYAIDLQPGDVIAPKPGINALQLTYQYSEKNDYYSHGQKNVAYAAVTSSTYALRVGHSFELAQMPVIFTYKHHLALSIHKA